MIQMNNKIIFDTISNGILILDENLNIVEWNRWLEVKTGIEREKIVNENLFKVFPYINKEKLNRKIKTSFLMNNHTFYNVIPHNFLIKIKNNKVVNEIFNYMQQDVTIIPYDVEKKLIRIYIYDKTTYCEINYKLKKLSNIDPLTNLFNRRYFNEVSKKFLNLSIRNNQQIRVAILDIDFFKRINDTYGHQTGDDALLAFANLLNENVRSSDIVTRYGGEEFVILLNNVDSEKTFNIFEKIRIKTKELKIRTIGNHFTNFSVSIGVTLFDKEKDKNIEDSLQRADKLLYISKQNGRNQVNID